VYRVTVRKLTPKKPKSFFKKP